MAIAQTFTKWSNLQTRQSQGVIHEYQRNLFHPSHLCFEQAQPKMYHSPKVDDGVDVFFKISWKPIFGRFFFEEFKTDITPKPLELFN